MQIGLSLCLGANLRSGGASFSPASLFADGDGALIQRRSDAFFVENTASTHAVDTNAVGFATDASEGAGYSGGAWAGLGVELVDTADSPASWLPYGSNTIEDIAGGVEISYVDDGRGARAIFSASGILSANMAAGVSYAVGFGVALNTGAASGLLANFTAAPTVSISTSLNEIRFASGRTAFAPEIYFNGLGSGEAVTVVDVSVREIPGAHLTQATTSYKPSLQTGGLLFDGNDDRLTGAPKPTTSGTIAARFNGSTASRVIFGSQAASDGRCFLALDASGKIAAGIGAQGTSTIAGGADIRGAWHTAAVTWDGSTVTLYLDGVSVYSAAQSGAVNTTVALMLGALNANGTAAAFWAGTVSDALVIDRVLTTDEITNLNTYWSA